MVFAWFLPPAPSGHLRDYNFSTTAMALFFNIHEFLFGYHKLFEA